MGISTLGKPVAESMISLKNNIQKHQTCYNTIEYHTGERSAAGLLMTLHKHHVNIQRMTFTHRCSIEILSQNQWCRTNA